MRIPFLGLTIERTKNYSVPAYGHGGWYPIVRESYPGAWQRNVTLDRTDVLSYHAIFACTTLIASDISKLRVKLIEREPSGVWTETENPAYSPVLRAPNHYQTSNQFWESWILSKLLHGNTYVLKQRDQRGVVSALYVLDPCRVKPTVADSGDIFYDVNQDDLNLVDTPIVVPARDIIHDRFNTLRHPLCGISPIFASYVAAAHGNKIQTGATVFFANRSIPGGILTAPGHIPDDTAERLKSAFEEKFSGENAGRLAVLGDGLKFESMTITAEQAQLVEQLGLTERIVCTAFKVPPYKIGIPPIPPYNNIQALNVEYYSTCLQKLIEDAEKCLDVGLGLANDVGVEFDINGLLRMDTVTQFTALEKAVGSGWMAPDEARKQFDLPPVEGGDSPYLQQQNYSLAALAKRDAKADPFATASAPETAPMADDSEEDIDAERLVAAIQMKAIGRFAAYVY